MKKIDQLEKYLEELHQEDTMYIPAIWNKYVGYQECNKISDQIIEVNTVKFYRFTIKRIKDMQCEINTDIKNSQIYCAMPRYTMAWDIHNQQCLSDGTLIRMLILLPTLKKMNINVLYLLPITEYSNRNKKGDIGSPFAIKDFYKLDPNLHDELVDGLKKFTLDDEFHVLVEACHILGIRVVIDFIPRVTARDSNLIKQHPDWVYWIKKDYEKDFLTPEIPGLDFFQECTEDNLEQVYSAQSTKKHLKQFVLPPNELNREEWEKILLEADQKGADLFQLIEDRMGITTPPAHSDWINDVQPIWTDITFWKLYFDNNPKAAQYVDNDQPPYVMFDTIKANKFPAKIPNQELWDLFTDVLEYYAKEFNLDGFRFDIGHTLPPELLKRLFEKVREYVQDPIFISEDLFNRNHENALRTGYNIMLGSSWKEVENITKPSYQTFISELSQMKIHAYACAETHDTPRIVTREGGINLARGLAIINNFLPNGVHFILSGYEVNETQPMNCGLADNTAGAKVDKAFFNRICMDWTGEHASEMLDYVIAVNQVRETYKNSIDPEKFKLLTVKDECICFTYDERIIICMNLDLKNKAELQIKEINLDDYVEVIHSARDTANTVADRDTIQLQAAEAVVLVKKKELIIWHEMDGVGDSSLEFIETICRELEEKEGLKFKFVKMNIKPFLKRLQNLEKETEKPDIIFIAQDMVSMEQAHLSEVPDTFCRYMEQKTWNSMKYKGIQRGVPYLQGNHAVLFYNKKYFPQGPKTWDEIIGLQQDQVCSFSVDLEVAYWLMPFIYSLYGNPIQNGKVSITPENTKEVQNFILYLQRHGILSSYSAISTMLDKFVAGEIACMINGEWLYKYLSEEMGENVGICCLPKIANTEMSGISSTVGVAFPQNSLNGVKKRELEVFIHYMLSKDVQKRWLLKHKRIPVNKEVINEIKTLNVDENIMVSCEQMKKNYFLVNEECIQELWEEGDKILKNIDKNLRI